jgi:hypothetical protein
MIAVWKRMSPGQKNSRRQPTPAPLAFVFVFDPTKKSKKNPCKVFWL